MIALLCPSKGRSEKLERMIKSAGSADIRTYIAIDSDPAYSLFVGKVNIMYTPDLMPTAHKWNILAQEALKNSDNKLFMIAGDDMVFDTPGWDKALIDHYNALENKIHVYHLQDSRDPEGTPHPICTREYINAMGYIYPPIFLHWMGDIWTKQIAEYNNCYTHLKDYLLIHDKDNDKGKPDATHTNIRSYGWLERDRWVHETCKNTLLVNEMQRLRSLMR